jgi:hypothetical protein
MESPRLIRPNDNRWWERPSFLIAISLLSTLPLLWPQIPPLVDLPGHIGRYRVELDLHSSINLQRYYDFHWMLIGNLGVDLLVVPLAPLIGLEPAVKLIVICIPVVTALGIFAVAREIHGYVPPATLFAIPFAYSYPFNYGFVNFTLSVGLALLAFALWLRLGQTGRLVRRALIFAPLSCGLWVVHVFGWGFLGLLSFSAEVVRFRDKQTSWLGAIRGAAMQMLPLCIPFVLILFWRSGDVSGETKTFFLIPWKLLTIVSALRDRWVIWDALGVAVCLVVIGAGILDRNLEFSRRLSLPAIALGIAFLALPYTLFGSAHADMRLVPYLIIIALIAVRFRERNPKSEAILAILGLAFATGRLAGNTASFAIADLDNRRVLSALDHVSRGDAVLTLTSGACAEPWALRRYWHLGALVIARRYGFTNDHWEAPGAQLMSARYAAAEPFHDIRSVLTFSPSCADRLNRNRPRGSEPVRTLQQSLDQFPRNAFKYVWLIKPPEGPYVVPSALTEIWREEDSRLYRVKPPQRANRTCRYNANSLDLPILASCSLL